MLTHAKAYVLAHWRPFAVALAVLVSFACGRGCAPKPTVQVQTKIEYQDRIVEKRVEVKVADTTQAKQVVVYRDKTKSPDGTVHVHEVEKTDTNTHETERTDTQTVRTEVQTVHEVQTVKVEAARPNWRIGALVGVDVQHPLTPAYGATVERRILGPVSVGAWGMSNGQGGASLTLEF